MGYEMMIPLYRAKKIDSEEYIEFESFFKYENDYFSITKIIKQNIDGMFSHVMIPLTQKIDHSTLSINFPYMLDSQGNKIFASLSEDGKGGDILEYEEIKYMSVVVRRGRTTFTDRKKHSAEIKQCIFKIFDISKKIKDNSKVIGIQQ